MREKMRDGNDPDESIGRISVTAIDAILGKKFTALDDGFIRVIDYLGGDESIVQAARVSYGRGTRPIQEDRGLIRYLIRHQHTTPLEMCEIKFHLRVPMHIWRQWIRHRTANVNEYSTRYSLAIDSMEKTGATAWRMQKNANRQGSEGVLDETSGRILSEREAEFQQLARKVYEERIAKGIAREQARKDLPLSTYTEAYWKIDLWNLFHFLKLRMDQAAQREIRIYAQIIGEEIVAKWVPLTWEAFLDYNIRSVQFSAPEVLLLSLLLGGKLSEAQLQMRSLGWLDWDEGKKQLKRNRERDEFFEKLKNKLDFALDSFLSALDRR
jgi:thymidylate synthase (FAD)